ncbi:MAG: OPT/YSL family transporter, partial [Planctomycetaceae bacterium]|nr:OPT/YSL family transporter [Planctomycetaceae bacterium]
MSSSEIDQNLVPEEPATQLYFPPQNERQLTIRAILVGCLVGSIVSCTNIYIGLKIGWAFGASIISAVLGFSFFAVINRKLTVLETNIAQTAGSAAGYMSSAAGLLAPIPAMAMLGFEYSWEALMVWAVSVAFLGVFFAVPLRRQMVDVDQLRFPTGTATAETILAMYSDAAEAIAKARALLIFGVLAAFFTVSYHFNPQLEKPPIDEWLPAIPFLATAAAWGFSVYLGPSLFGAGFLIGPRVVFSLVLGAVLGWAVLGPISQQSGWAPGAIMSYKDGPRGWILWPGVALMVAEALGALAFSWRTFVNALTMPVAKNLEGVDTADPNAIPNSWWIGGLIGGSLFAVIMTQTVFGIPWYLGLIAIAI